MNFSSILRDGFDIPRFSNRLGALPHVVFTTCRGGNLNIRTILAEVPAGCWKKKFDGCIPIIKNMRVEFLYFADFAFRLLLNLLHYRPQMKFAKVTFLQVSVCPQRGSVHGRGSVYGREACVAGGMCGDMCGMGLCVAGGMCVAGGHV